MILSLRLKELQEPRPAGLPCNTSSATRFRAADHLTVGTPTHGLLLSPNTVYLSLKDEWLTFDAWRVSVTGVFDRVDGHLAFDDSGVGSVGAGGEQFVEDLDGDALAGVGESVRGKNPGGWRWFAERPGGSG